MALQIIGAGFPRTGTTTLKKALETLGYFKTYHFKDLIANPSKLRYWTELENTGTTDFETLFNGYAATVDFPGYPYYKILMEKYPDAKVILTKRDADAWYTSVSNTIWQAGPQTLFAKIGMACKMLIDQQLKNKVSCIKLAKEVFIRKQFNGQFASKEAAKKEFLRHIEEVIENVPKEKLLVYDVSEGWEPLCRFLSCDIPNEPFPHLNKKENFHTMVKGMLKEPAMAV